MDINKSPLWTAIITPLNEDESVDYKSLENLLREQEQAGNGILILGSTGEALNLSLQEMKDILDFSLGLKLNAPFMCGVGGIHLETTLNWIDHLNKLNLDCYLLVTPLYAKPGDKGQFHWFKTLMDRATKPCMLYNVPSRTGTALSVNACEALKEHEKFWALKEASGSTEDFSEYVNAVGPNVKVYSGDDPMLPAYVPLGAKGLVSVAANVWPKQTHEYTKLALSGELSSEDTHLWKEASEALFVASNPIPTKAILKNLGRISTDILKSPLTNADMQNLSLVEDVNNKITNWKK